MRFSWFLYIPIFEALQGLRAIHLSDTMSRIVQGSPIKDCNH